MSTTNPFVLPVSETVVNVTSFPLTNMETCLKEAEHPETTPDRLDQLYRIYQFYRSPLTQAPYYQNYQKELLRRVAHNPNTPSPVLIALLKHFSIEVLTNPVLPLLCLENPAFFSTIPQEILLHLATCRTLPYLKPFLGEKETVY